jgi:hypothetical protein
MDRNTSDYVATAAGRNEPTILDADMTPGDINDALRRLRFSNDFLRGQIGSRRARLSRVRFASQVKAPSALASFASIHPDTIALLIKDRHRLLLEVL